MRSLPALLLVSALLGPSQCFGQAGPSGPAPPTTFNREVGLLVAHMPECDIVSYFVEIEVPGIYSIVTTPTSNHAKNVGPQGRWKVDILPTREGGHLITVAASFSGPIQLDGYAVRFVLTAPTPGALSEPIVLRSFFAVLATGGRSRKLTSDLLIQAGADGVFGPRP